MYILRWWSGIANILTQGILKRDVNVQSIIDDFGELIYREIDYVAEAANAQRFNEIYANLPISIFVPKIYSTLTTSKVLTMEWVDGLRLTDTAALQQYGLDKEEVRTIGEAIVLHHYCYAILTRRFAPRRLAAAGRLPRAVFPEADPRQRLLPRRPPCGKYAGD